MARAKVVMAGAEVLTAGAKVLTARAKVIMALVDQRCAQKWLPAPTFSHSGSHKSAISREKAGALTHLGGWMEHVKNVLPPAREFDLARLGRSQGGPQTTLD